MDRIVGVDDGISCQRERKGMRREKCGVVMVILRVCKIYLVYPSVSRYFLYDQVAVESIYHSNLTSPMHSSIVKRCNSLCIVVLINAKPVS